MKWSIDSGTATSFALVLVALLASTGLAYVHLRQLAENERKIGLTHRILATAADLQVALTDAETGVRGYMLTGEEPYLDAFNSSGVRMPQLFASLQGLLSDNADQLSRLARMREQASVRLELLRGGIKSRARGGLTEAARHSRGGEGKKEMDDFRTTLAAFLEEEEALLAARSEQSRRSYTTALVTGLGTAVLGVALVGVAYGLVARELRSREKATAAITRERERFQTLAEAMPQMVWTATPAGEVDYYNPRWYDYTGLTHDQTRGRGWRDAVHPDDREAGGRGWADAVTRGDQYQVEQRLRRADGVYRWHLVRATTLRDPSGAIVLWIGTITDVDDQHRQAEALDAAVRERTAELATAAEALRQSNRELEQFASVASHDLQEPLRKIQAFGSRLQTRFASVLADQGREYIERMQSSAARMRRLIEDLLSYSRVTSKAQPFQAVDLAEVAEGVVADLEERVRETGGTIDVGPLPTVEADPLQMRQLLQNLLGNALKFHRPGVPPVVEVRAELDADAGVCKLAVRDNGIGFEERYLDRIFEMFQRLHGRAEYEGMGMGLAICRKIVERHGGSISATSTPGRGSAFVVRLPLSRQQEEPRRHAIAQPAGHDLDGR